MKRKKAFYWWDLKGKNKKTHIIIKFGNKSKIIAKFYKKKNEPTFERQIQLAELIVAELEKEIK